MVKSFTFFQNFLVTSFVFCFVFVGVYVPQPLNNVPQAEAQLIVNDPISTALSAISNIYTIASNFLQNLLYEKEYILDGIMFALAMDLASQITVNIVKWVNTGLDNSPMFIQDLKAHSLSIADEEFENYDQELGWPLSFVCSPFQVDVRRALSESYNQRREGLPQAGSCTLDGSLANIENFISRDFSDGGWEAWYRIVNKPEIYTPYGSYLEAENQLNVRTTAAQERDTRESNWGKGYMAKKDCEVISSTGERRCKVVTPGDTIAQSLNFHLTTGTRGLLEADEINEVIGALIGQLAERVITGDGGLLGVSSASDGGSSYLDDIAGEGFNLYNLRSSVSESLATAERYRREALLYAGLLTEFAASTTNSQSRRGQALAEANNIVQNLIPFLDQIIVALTDLLNIIDTAPSNPDSDFIRSVTQRYSTLRPTLPSSSQVDGSILQWRTMINPDLGG